MKERILELIEELVGAHSYGAKREKADEIGALVKTAVFPADQVDEPEAEPISLGPVSAVVTTGNVLTMPQVSNDMAAQQQLPGDPAAENSAADAENHHD